MGKRRRSISTLGLLVALVFAGCGDGDEVTLDTVRGSGRAATESRAVTGFSSVEVAGNAEVMIDAGVAEAVTVTADDNVLPLLTTVVEDGKLVLGVEDRRTIDPDGRIIFRVGVQRLEGVVVSGVADVSARGIDAESFTVAVSGVGNVRLLGTTRHLAAELDGAGDIDAFGLAAQTASASIDGAGSISLTADESLDASIGGAGSLLYTGDPVVSSEASLTGTITQVPVGTTQPAPTSEFLVVPSPSLAGNLLGDPAELPVAVWLPASYGGSSKRYPVVYFLSGFDEAASTAAIGTALQRLIEAGDVPEMILVGVSGTNSLGGSFYVDSPVTGNWAQAISADLVTAIDRSYRTLVAASSRGVAGFSMGGFGALDLAMRHPEVFGSVYALSPGLFAPGGLETTSMFADESVIAEFLALQGAPAGEQSRGSEGLNFSIAYGSAFAPDVDAFPHVSYPYRSVDSPPDADIWRLWEAGYGGIADEVAEYRDNLLSLRGIAVDFGTSDRYEWIPDGCRYLAEQLNSHDIPAQITSYEGGHGPIGPRAETVMFPFFARVLDVGQ